MIDPEGTFPVQVVDPAKYGEYVHTRWSEPFCEYFVVFDEPQYDGDGCGPYKSAVVWETYLRPLPEST